MMQVDMTWHGHHHSYQRTCPVINSKCQGYDSDGAAKVALHPPLLLSPPRGLLPQHAGLGLDCMQAGPHH